LNGTGVVRRGDEQPGGEENWLAASLAIARSTQELVAPGGVSVIFVLFNSLEVKQANN